MSKESCYILGGSSFKTKKEIKCYIQKLISKLKHGDRVSDPVLLDLLSKHPEWNQKSFGYEKVELRDEFKPEFGKKCKILYVIGEKDNDISWAKIIPLLNKDGSIKEKSKSQDSLDEFKLAARIAVSDQIDAVRQPGLEVDHEHPRTFASLLWLFMKINRYKISKVEISSPDGILRVFADEQFKLKWQNFHLRHSRLRAISPEEHKKQPIDTPNWKEVF